MGLDDWRSRIDNLDEEILNLLNRRGQAALQIGELKRQQDLPYFVPERESQILERLVALNGGPLSADAVRAVWREILSASLALEQCRNGEQRRYRDSKYDSLEQWKRHVRYLITNLWPEASVIEVDCIDPAALLPSLARAAPSTVTLSPIFTVSRFHPPRTRA